MNLSELTNKIYAEGVEKGNAEAAATVSYTHLTLPTNVNV